MNPAIHKSLVFLAARLWPTFLCFVLATPSSPQGKDVVDEELELEVYRRGQNDLTLIDLPGHITHAHAQNHSYPTTTDVHTHVRHDTSGHPGPTRRYRTDNQGDVQGKSLTECKNLFIIILAVKFAHSCAALHDSRGNRALEHCERDG